jgi:hypothetical protein
MFRPTCRRLPLSRWRPCLERLEDRLAPALDVPFAGGALPAGVEAIVWNGEPTYAYSGRWLFAVDSPANIAGGATAHLNNSLRLLTADRGAITVSGQLDGGVLTLTTDPGTKYTELRQTLLGVAGFRYLEPDFVVWVDAVPNDPSFSQL